MLTKFVQPVRKIFKLVYLSPLFLGPVVSIPPMNAFDRHNLVKNYAFFLAIWASWLILFNFVVKVYQPFRSSKEGAGKAKSALMLAGLVTSALLCMGGIEAFRITSPGPRLWAVLTAMGLHALRHAAFKGKRTAFGLSLYFLETLILSYLSFMMIGYGFLWETVFPCLSLSFLLTGCRAAALLTSASVEKPSYLLRLQPMLLFLGPVTICLAAVSGILENAYLASCLIIPFIAGIATLGRGGEKEGAIDKRLLLHSEIAAFTQIAILLALGIIQRHFYLF